MAKKNRWVLLEHVGSPEDSEGIHFDLLLEDQNACRSWRMPRIPVLDGPSQEAIPLPLHKLKWLDIEEEEVSGGRGRARRLFSGNFLGELSDNVSDPVCIQLHSLELVGCLEIKDSLCRLSSLSSPCSY